MKSISNSCLQAAPPLGSVIDRRLGEDRRDPWRSVDEIL